MFAITIFDKPELNVERARKEIVLIFRSEPSGAVVHVVSYSQP